MEKVTQTINYFISIIVTTILAIYNKVPLIMWFFISAVCIDYITGFIKSKWFLNNWNSEEGFRGLIKKLMYFILIAVAFLISHSIAQAGVYFNINLEFASLLGWYVVVVLLINELGSILENLYVIHPDKIPVWLIKGMKIANTAINDKISNAVCKDQNCDVCEIKDKCTKKKYKSDN